MMENMDRDTGQKSKNYVKKEKYKRLLSEHFYTGGENMLKDSLASALRSVQKSRGLSERGLSELLQVPRMTVHALLEGNANPTLQTIERIAQQLQLDPIVLITDLKLDDALVRSFFFLIKSFVDLPAQKQWEAARLIREFVEALTTNRTPEP